jgi:hypothetical protein
LFPINSYERHQSKRLYFAATVFHVSTCSTACEPSGLRFPHYCRNAMTFLYKSAH